MNLSSKKLFLLIFFFFFGSLYSLNSTEIKKDPIPLGTFNDNGTLIFVSADGRFKYWLDGRIQIDYGKIFDSKNKLPSGVKARRVRFAIKSVLHKTWAGELDLSITPTLEPDENNDIKVMDLWIAYNGLPNTTIKFGNQKPCFSIEELTTSRWIMFMERSLPNAFQLGRRVGVSVTTWQDFGIPWWLGAGFFGDEVARGAEDGEEESGLIVSRLCVLPLYHDNLILQVGGSCYKMEAEEGTMDTMRLKATEFHHQKHKLLDTDIILGVDHLIGSGIEGVVQWNNFMLQGEYMSLNVFRKNSYKDAYFNGYYVQASYILTGEKHGYDRLQAEFTGVQPKDFDLGAWEVALRLSGINLTDEDADIWGGAATYTTLGLNWHINTNIKAVINYLITDHDKHANKRKTLQGNDDFSVLSMRLQYLF